MSVIFPTTVFRQKSPDNLALLLSLNRRNLVCGIKLCNLISSSKFLFNFDEIQSFCRKISPIFHFWQNFGGICFGLNFRRNQKIGSANALRVSAIIGSSLRCQFLFNQKSYKEQQGTSKKIFYSGSIQN